MGGGGAGDGGDTPLVDSCRGSSTHLQDGSRSQTPTPTSSMGGDSQLSANYGGRGGGGGMRQHSGGEDEAYYSRTLPLRPRPVPGPTPSHGSTGLSTARKPSYLPLLPQQRSLDDDNRGASQRQRHRQQPPLPQPSYSQGYINFPRLNESPTLTSDEGGAGRGKKGRQTFFPGGGRQQQQPRGSYNDLTRQDSYDTGYRPSRADQWEDSLRRRTNVVSSTQQSDRYWQQNNMTPSPATRSRSQPYLQQLTTSEDESDWC